MIKVLLKAFGIDEKSKTDAEKRMNYSVFAGILGIVCNFVLFGIKLFAGIAMSSIAVISDAFNNLSDMGASVVSIVGAKLSGKKPDREHPFGHGRVEYISSLIVSFIIFLVGFELLKNSVGKIFNPVTVILRPLVLVVLGFSVLIKLWMFSYNRFLGQKIGSQVLFAVSRDSINDAFATSAVILSAVLGKLWNFPVLDGIVGTVVSGVIIYSGFGISRNTIGILLGAVPEKRLTEDIQRLVLSAEGIIGVHDLMVHDYGPGRVLASVHAEVSDHSGIVEVHNVIDALERRIEEELGVHIVVHMDPISIDCEKTSAMRELVNTAVKEVDETLKIHDFRMAEEEERIILVFDIEASDLFSDADVLKSTVIEKLKKKNSCIEAKINVDLAYD